MRKARVRPVPRWRAAEQAGRVGPCSGHRGRVHGVDTEVAAAIYDHSVLVAFPREEFSI
jgi:hypothetical protein